MECPSCNFQNTPGMKTCLRCCTRLDFSDVQVEPPRASGVAAVRAVRRAQDVVDIGVRNVASRMTLPRMGSGSSPFRGATSAELWASLIPGGGQLVRGERRLGRGLLLAWLAFIVLAAASLGTDLQWLFNLGIMGTHSLAINLLLRRELANMGLRQRAAWGIVIYVSIVVCVYVPAAWILTGLFQVRQIDGFTPTRQMQPGDVLLISGRWLTPERWKRGDLVYFRHSGFNFGHAWGSAGYAVDRILAGPGESVMFVDGVPQVKGVDLPGEMWPLRPMRPGFNTALHAGTDEVIVLPSLARMVTGGNGEMGTIMSTIGRVDTGHVYGKVLYRLRPLSRFGSIE
ncbi:MAG: hypothetical protein JSR77_16185 [Planctomycetes bacterium]|nr:hypothetical protein [Planctomycetota bacterium]